MNNTTKYYLLYEQYTNSNEYYLIPLRDIKIIRTISINNTTNSMNNIINSIIQYHTVLNSILYITDSMVYIIKQYSVCIIYIIIYYFACACTRE